MAKPIYQNIVEELTKEIKKMPANTPIISERELSIRFSTSRMTARKAINILVDSGYLYRDKNRGTFVADEKMHKTNTSLNHSFNLENQITHKIIYFDVKSDIRDEYIVKQLNVEINEQIIRVIRLNLKNNVVQDLEEIYLPRNRTVKKDMMDIKKNLDFTDLINDGSIVQKFIPMKVPTKYMHLIGVKMDTPIIMIESLIADKTGLPLVFIKTYNNPEEKCIKITT